MFIATVENKGSTFYLKGSTWAFHVDRAQQFDTREAVEAGIAKAVKFMPKSLAKKIKIEQI